MIAKAGKPVARLVPFRVAKVKRRLGTLAGKLRVSEDFDAPLPDDILDAFEGRQCGSCSTPILCCGRLGDGNRSRSAGLWPACGRNARVLRAGAVPPEKYAGYRRMMPAAPAGS